MDIKNIISPYNHYYVPLFKEHLKSNIINPKNRDELYSISRDSGKLFLFAERHSLEYIKNTNATNNIIFFRRHELYDVSPELILRCRRSFNKVYTVNKFLQNKLKSEYNIESELDKNYVNENLWSFKSRSHGNKIAWVGEFKDRKAPDYIVEVAQHYRNYEFHCAVSRGPSKQLYLDFINNFKLKNIFIYEDINTQDKMNNFLEDKNYLLTTSISEGLPNCVLEALAKGIKPIIRDYPGNIFNEFTYRSLLDIKYHLISEYNSSEYRKIIINNFCTNEFLKFKDKVLQL